MYTSLAVIGLAATAAAKAIPQGVTANIVAPGAPAPGCRSDYAQSFQINTINATTSRTQKRQVDPNTVPGGPLIITLAGGQLHNQDGDTGYIADNRQFQFDSPPQTGAVYTGGFSVCTNQTTQGPIDFLAIGGTTVFYSCNSGGFNNLYDQSTAAQCSQVYIQVLPEGGASSSAGASQTTDGQAQATTAAPGVTRISDQQPQASTAAPGVTRISDQQPQAPTTAAGVTRISDQQPQAPTTAAGVTRISDQQPQAPTTAAGITQISDNQPQAPTTAAGITQISDNQPQAPTTATPLTPVRSPAPAYTGAAAANGLSNLALAGAAVAGLAML